MWNVAEIAGITALLVFILDCLKSLWKIEQDRKRDEKHKKHKKKPPTTSTRRQLKLNIKIVWR